jgi:hypothetical protein
MVTSPATSAGSRSPSSPTTIAAAICRSVASLASSAASFFAMPFPSETAMSSEIVLPRYCSKQ